MGAPLRRRVGACWVEDPKNILDGEVSQEVLRLSSDPPPLVPGGLAWDAVGVQFCGGRDNSKTEWGAKLILAGRLGPSCVSASMCGLRGAMDSTTIRKGFANLGCAVCSSTRPAHLGAKFCEGRFELATSWVGL